MDETTLAALAAFPAQLEANYAAIPDDCKHWRPDSWDGIPSEQLTPIEQLCHVRDIEVDGYQVRFRRTLDEANPLLPSIDTDALVRERHYSAADAHQVLAAFRAARAETVRLLAGLAPEQLGRPATFEGYGPVTLRSLVHYLCSHDQQHLAGLQWLMGKMASQRRGG
jgi:hypothetical protein